MTKTIEEDNKRIGSVTRKGKKEKKNTQKKRQKEREAREKTKAIKHVKKKNNREEREENTQLSMVIELKGGDRGRGKDKANDEEQKIKK